MQHLQPNTTLQGGKYRIERVLGQGGFGITYLARSTVFDVNVAIKEFFMKDENGRDGSMVTIPNTTKTELFLGQKEKFKKEAKRMFAIKNEHVVAVHDLFEENGTAYYVMDYVDGENLSDRLKRTGRPMSEDEVSKILPQILDALKAIHDVGIWHLDLKPANILLGKEGNVKLVDFGASKQFNAQKGGATTSTAISYTPGYAPREQMEQSYEKFGPWTDFYALGGTIYHLLTNKRPPLPTDIDDDRSDDKHLALPLPAEVSPKMKQLILWLMKTDRLGRPTSVKKIQKFMDDPFSPGAHADFGRNGVPDNDGTIIEEGEVEMARPRQGKILKIVLASCIALAVAFGGYYLWNHVQSGKNQVDVENKGETQSSNGETTKDTVEVEKKEEEPQFSPVIQNLIDNMVHVEGGTFTMGSINGQDNQIEAGAHQVTLSSFSIGKYEVTQEEWQAVMGNNPSRYKGAKRPVEMVSWEDCKEFIYKLNEMTGKQFRLPTEAEWEFAARGGNQSKGYKYAGSNDLGSVAWFDKNCVETHNVGGKQPNELGLYDMSGNVFEWCQDWYSNYDLSVQTNPKGASSGFCRVMRGGDFVSFADDCHVLLRADNYPDERNSAFGFRLAH